MVAIMGTRARVVLDGPVRLEPAGRALDGRIAWAERGVRQTFPVGVGDVAVGVEDGVGGTLIADAAPAGRFVPVPHRGVAAIERAKERLAPGDGGMGFAVIEGSEEPEGDSGLVGGLSIATEGAVGLLGGEEVGLGAEELGMIVRHAGLEERATGEGGRCCADVGEPAAVGRLSTEEVSDAAEFSGAGIAGKGVGGEGERGGKRGGGEGQERGEGGEAAGRAGVPVLAVAEERFDATEEIGLRGGHGKGEIGPGVRGELEKTLGIGDGIGQARGGDVGKVLLIAMQLATQQIKRGLIEQDDGGKTLKGADQRIAVMNVGEFMGEGEVAVRQVRRRDDHGTQEATGEGGGEGIVGENRDVVVMSEGSAATAELMHGDECAEKTGEHNGGGEDEGDGDSFAPGEGERGGERWRADSCGRCGGGRHIKR